MRGRVRIVFSCIFLCIMMLSMKLHAEASQGNEQEKEVDITQSSESMLDDFDFDEIDNSLAQIFPSEKLNFKEIVMKIIA